MTCKGVSLSTEIPGSIPLSGVWIFKLTLPQVKQRTGMIMILGAEAHYLPFIALDAIYIHYRSFERQLLSVCEVCYTPQL